MNEAKPEVKFDPGSPWDALYEVAANQQGCFTREQARGVGFSDQLLYKHVRAGNVERLQRGIYRITRFPDSGREREDLVVLWLWSDSEGVFSHETALRLHGLSDVLPSRVHLSLPASWRDRHLTAPPGAHLAFADVPTADRSFIGAIPVTRPARTINDVAMVCGDAIVVEAAVRQAIQRGLVSPGELLPAVEYLAGLRSADHAAGATAGGPWFLDVLCGTCPTAPRADWRTVAQEAAVSVGGHLRSSRYDPGARSMIVEVLWPASTAEPRRVDELRTILVERFGWVG